MAFQLAYGSSFCATLAFLPGKKSSSTSLPFSCFPCASAGLSVPAAGSEADAADAAEACLAERRPRDGARSAAAAGEEVEEPGESPAGV